MSKTLNEKVDVYSFALTMWEILTGREPYSHVDSVEKLVKYVCMEGGRPDIPKAWPQTLRELIAQCWHPQPDLRFHVSFFAFLPQLFSQALFREYCQQNAGCSRRNRHS